jgi:transaldolase
LIGRDTINTITPTTLEAFRDHGRLRASLEDDIDDARARLAALERVGISLSDVTDKLLEHGVTLFCKAFDHLLAAVDEGRGRAT